MKKFEIIIKKTIEKRLEMYANDSNEVLENAIQLLNENEEELLKNVDKNKQFYEIKVTKINNEKHTETDKIIDKIISQIEKDLDENEEQTERKLKGFLS